MNQKEIDDIFENLTPEERAEAFKILNEISVSTVGKSELLDALYKEDYEEIPVDIDTFIESDLYCGKTTGNGKLIYPYWREQLRKLFKDPNEFQEVAVTGCLSGNTIIPLLNGKKISIKELALMNKLDEYVYSFDVDINKYVPGHLVDAFSTGVKDVYKITLDNGEFVIATSNHKFMLRNKNWKSIDSGLKVGDSLMPLYRGSVKCGNGYYESIKHPQKDGTFIEEPTHRMVMRNKIGNFKGVVHHKDFNKYNNDPRNLLKSDWNAHKMYHARSGGKHFAEHNRKYKNGELSDEMYEKIRQGALYGSRKRWSNPEEHKKMSELTTYRMKNGFSKKMSDIRWSDAKEHEKVSKQWAELNRDPELNIKRQIMKGVKISNLVLNENLELNEENYNAIKLKNNMRSGYPQYKSVLKYITEEELLELASNYNHKIVSIEYIGKEEVYDLTVERYHNFALESGIVAHNSIGTGKSTMACYGMAYLLYRTMCLKDPVAFYKLTGGSTVVFSFFNNTLDLVNAVGYGTIQKIVLASPWFMERGTVSGIKNPEYVPYKPIRFKVGSTAGHALGMHILSAMLDEVSFKQGASVIMEQSKIMETYAGVKSRMESRFMVNGKIAGKMFIVSSKKSEYDFLENYIRKQKGKPGVMVCDAKLWDVKPAGSYLGKKFLLAVGGSNKPSKIVPEEEVQYQITTDDGNKKTYNFNDVVTLINGKEKKIQDLKVGDEIK